ncbi:glycosyltransferase [candidate division TA06 bacterium]|nr:glycosyltransferase [candidate division TA06 bacterium]
MMFEAQNKDIWFIIMGDESSSDAQRAINLAGHWLRLKPVFVFCHPGGARLRDIWFSIWKKRPAAVYCFSYNYFILMLALGCRIFWPRLKFVFDTGDLAYKLSKLFFYTRLQTHLLGIYEWLILRLASAVVVRGRWHVEYLKKGGLKNILLIPDGVDLAEVRETNSSALKEKLFGPGSFVVGLVGFLLWPNNLGVIWYGWDLLEAARLLKDTPIKFALAGYGPGQNEFETKIKEYGLEDNVRYLGRMSREQTSEWISMFDIALNTQPNADAFWVRTTGKLPLYLAANRYILTSDVGEAHYILPQEMLIPYQGLVDLDYPPRLAQKILELYNNRQKLFLGDGGRRLADALFSYEKLSVLLEEELITSVL